MRTKGIYLAPLRAAGTANGPTPAQASKRREFGPSLDTILECSEESRGFQ